MDELYWCAADPGWAYGLYFGILSSLTGGIPSLLVNAPFSPELTWRVLDGFPVANIAAAPTVYRALRASSASVPRGLRLRCASSAGEPQTPEVNEWALKALGVPVNDHYGQTEAGMLVNNHHHPDLVAPLRLGSMGQAMPGWRVVVLRDDRDEEAAAGTLGRIAVDIAASPLDPGSRATSTIRQEPGEVHRRRCWPDRRRRRMDEDGTCTSARDDDVIIMADTGSGRSRSSRCSPPIRPWPSRP
jgi:acetyl-CoA synthetase